MTVTLDDLHGRILDVDSHEQVAPSRYAEVFGERGRLMLEEGDSFPPQVDQAGFPIADLDDVTEDLTDRAVWETKGVGAVSAEDLSRRPAVMDRMGIRRQLVFPTFGIHAINQAHGGAFNGRPWATPEQMEIARGAMGAYNEWASQFNTATYRDRLRMVGLLGSGLPGVTPESLLKETESLIEMGMAAIWVHAGTPPAGLSPYDPDLDPFYATLAEANVPMVFHAGGEGAFKRSNEWGTVPLVTTHQADENFIAMMTLGGVFERHPTLRLGVIETGAIWIGPLAENMDNRLNRHLRERANGEVRGDFLTFYDHLSMTPSEYIARNVRVSVLLDEPIEVWLERYPALHDVFCYSSDYPHVEGRKWSLSEFYDRVAPFGDDVVEKFFVANAELLLP